MKTAVVTSIETFNRTMPEARAGDNVGCLLRGVKKDEIQRGYALAAPGSIKACNKFQAEIYVLDKNEGGRHTPFFSGYRPQFFFRTADITGDLHLVDTEMCMPGDNATVNVLLTKSIAMEQGLRFAIREGGRTVGSGVVTKC